MDNKELVCTLEKLSRLLEKRDISLEKELWDGLLDVLDIIFSNVDVYFMVLNSELDLIPKYRNKTITELTWKLGSDSWRVVWNRERIFSQNCSIPAVVSLMTDNNYSYITFFPYRMNSVIIGLCCFATASPAAFTDEELNIFEHFTTVLSIGLTKLKTEQELHRTGQWLETIAGICPETLLILDSSDRVLFSNRVAAERLGVKSLSNSNIRKLLSDDFYNAYRQSAVGTEPGHGMFRGKYGSVESRNLVEHVSTDRVSDTVLYSIAESKGLENMLDFILDSCECLGFIADSSTGQTRYLSPGWLLMHGKEKIQMDNILASLEHDGTTSTISLDISDEHYDGNMKNIDGQLLGFLTRRTDKTIPVNMTGPYRDLSRTISLARSENELASILFDKIGSIFDIKKLLICLSENIHSSFHDDDFFNKSKVSEFKDFISEHAQQRPVFLLPANNPVIPETEVLVIRMFDRKTHRGFIAIGAQDDLPGYPAMVRFLREIGTDISFVLRSIELEKENSLITAQLLKTRKLETVSTLAGGIAHDFNNILTPILGFADLLLMERDQTPKYYNYLQQIVKATERAKKLVNQVLIFSRQIDQDFHSIDLVGVLSETIDLLRASLSENVALEFKTPERQLAINGNSALLNQVLIHIFNNAITSLKDRRGRIAIDLSETEIDSDRQRRHPNLKIGNYAMLRITDNGSGMDDRTLERAFDPFFTTKPVGEGSGMGLSVVHGIISSHDGAIEIRSTVDVGTEVSMYFPLRSKSYSQEYIRQSSKDKERILLVDDENNVTYVLNEMLTKLGYDVSVRDTGRSALELFMKDPEYFDMVITDQAMPGMSGMILIEKLLQINPQLPTAIITGYSDSSTRARGRQLGIDAFVMKPVVIRELAEVIRNALDKRSR